MVPFFLDTRYKLDHNFGPKNIYLSFIGEIFTSAHNRKLFSSFFYQSSCVCKENVDGADCSRCKNRHYGLSKVNPKGCSPCNCHKPGCFGNIATCSNITGQCYCKEFVGGQSCGECKDGFYSLNRFNLFGCTGKMFII